MRPVPRLHLISDRRRCPPERFPEVARDAVEAGVDAVHVRERDLSARDLLDFSGAVRLAIGDRALLFVNDRLDVALLSGADGVQLPETSFSPVDARALGDNRLMIGRSVHDIAGAKVASASGAHLLVAGHVYATESKAGEVARGLEFLREICRAVDIPVIAIGGITPERVAEVLAVGAHGVAVISGILSAADPGEAARAYRATLSNVIE
jgi:thiamine-phosphate diphosphorylase